MNRHNKTTNELCSESMRAIIAHLSDQIAFCRQELAKKRSSGLVVCDASRCAVYAETTFAAVLRGDKPPQVLSARDARYVVARFAEEGFPVQAIRAKDWAEQMLNGLVWRRNNWAKELDAILAN